MMTVIIIVWIALGSPQQDSASEVQAAVLPMEQGVTVDECKAAAGDEMAKLDLSKLQMLGWGCVSIPFVKADNA